MDYDIPDDLLASLKLEEGYTDYIYQDTAEEKHATSGMGHKLSEAEKKVLGVREGGYIQFKIPNIGLRMVAVDTSGTPIQVGSETLTRWQKEDVQVAYANAINDAKALGTDNQKLINSLTHVNFQLGGSWNTKKTKFPTAWQALKDKDWEKAKDNLKYAKPAISKAVKDTSDWFKTTPSRVNNFISAITEYGNLYDKQSMDPDTHVVEKKANN
tara:strand:- start:42 stop:680 length:639 start_codon:yes stop_codon:yes gene_type:complete